MHGASCAHEAGQRKVGSGVACAWAAAPRRVATATALVVACEDRSTRLGGGSPHAADLGAGMSLPGGYRVSSSKVMRLEKAGELPSATLKMVGWTEPETGAGQARMGSPNRCRVGEALAGLTALSDLALLMVMRVAPLLLCSTRC